MVHYLLDVKEYRSIGYIGGIYEKDGVRIGTHRLMGLTEILAQRGCYKEHYFCVGEISRESGYRLTRELLETDDVPEVLVLGNDEVAEGALEAVKDVHRVDGAVEHGLLPPQEPRRSGSSPTRNRGRRAGAGPRRSWTPRG